MKKTSKLQARTVSEWLDIATKDLATSAKQRITSEIENHYYDALQAHLAEDRDPLAASLHALKELGDPRVAAKIYRKKYLSLKEEEEVRELMTQSNKLSPRLIILWASAALSVFFGIPLIQTMAKEPIMLTCAGIFLAHGLVPFLSRRFFKGVSRKRAINGILLLEPLRAIGVGLMTAVIFFTMMPRLWYIVVICLSAASSLSHWLPIRSKFLKTVA
jgi:hypothetical protein